MHLSDTSRRPSRPAFPMTTSKQKKKKKKTSVGRLVMSRQSRSASVPLVSSASLTLPACVLKAHLGIPAAPANEGSAASPAQGTADAAPPGELSGSTWGPHESGLLPARRPFASPGRPVWKAAAAPPLGSSAGFWNSLVFPAIEKKENAETAIPGRIRGRSYSVGNEWSLWHGGSPLFSPTSFCHLGWPPFLFPEERSLRPYHSSSRWSHLAALVVAARLQFFARNLNLIVRSLRLSSPRKRGINNGWNCHIQRPAADGSRVKVLTVWNFF